MHLGIDASRSTVAQRTGTEAYSLHLLRALLAQSAARPQPPLITLYFRDQPAPDLFPSYPHVRRRVIPWPRLWTHVRLAAAVARARPDLLFVPAHTLPLAFPGRAVVTVHDLGYEHFPQTHPPLQLAYLRWSTRHSARRANLIMADCEATAADLRRFYGVAPAKVRVVYPGVAPNLAPVGDPARLEAVRARYRIPALTY